MKIVVFGTGKYYQNRKDKLIGRAEIIAYLDNDTQKQGRVFDGKTVFPPESISGLDYDIALLMCGVEHRSVFRNQLIANGVDSERIWSWNKYLSLEFNDNRDITEYVSEGVLIISDELEFNGGSIAAKYMAMALKELGFEVSIMAPAVDARFEEELKKNQIKSTIWGKLPYINENDAEMFANYELIIVNTFQMSNCAIVLNKITKVIVWIHEPIDMYQVTMDEFPELYDAKKWEGIPVFAVSEVAARNFNKIYPERVDGILTYGIPDQRQMKNNKDNNEPIVFAIIGAIGELKGHDIFLEAIDMLEEQPYNAEYWIIGGHASESFERIIREKCEEHNSIKYYGEIVHDEILELISSIDVIVLPSRRDSLPITITEGLMNAVPCIVSDACGTADMLEDFVDARICTAGDCSSLYECMKWMILHKAEREEMALKGREVYENHFSVGKFKESLLTLFIS